MVKQVVLRRLVSGLSLRKSSFDHGQLAIDRMALGQVYIGVLRVSLLSIIPPVLPYAFNHLSLTLNNLINYQHR